MKAMRDAVLVEVIDQVVVEACTDVEVHRLELDEYQRQAVYEANQISPPVIMRHTHALNLQLTHGKKSIVERVAVVDDLRSFPLRLAPLITPLHRYAQTNIAVEFPVVLHKRARQIYAR